MALRAEFASIPDEVREIIEVLVRAGFRAVVVGGSVRDLLLGRVPDDFDVATSAKPADVQRAFRRVIPTGVEHGTVTVISRGRPVEVTTFRAEGDYVDGRRPSKVEFHDDVEVDLSRRDFTINAMAFDPTTSGLVDPFGGEEDLKRRLVRCVGVPSERFSEDGLRPLRAVRFATVLDFSLDPPTEAAIPPTLAVFGKVALERKRVELVKILLAEKASRGLELLDRTGLRSGYFQKARPDRFSAVDRAPRSEAIRLAVLFDQSVDVFRTLTELKFPNHIAQEAAQLVAGQTLPLAEATDGDLRRWLQKAGAERLEALLAINSALGETVEGLADRLRSIAATKPPLSTRDLALDGRAIMDALGVPQSKLVGEAGRFLLERVLDEPSSNTPEALLALLKGWSGR